MCVRTPLPMPLEESTENKSVCSWINHRNYLIIILWMWRVLLKNSIFIPVHMITEHIICCIHYYFTSADFETLYLQESVFAMKLFHCKIQIVSFCLNFLLPVTGCWITHYIMNMGIITTKVPKLNATSGNRNFLISSLSYVGMLHNIQLEYYNSVYLSTF